jgi:hemin uptake protein HemP
MQLIAQSPGLSAAPQAEPEPPELMSQDLLGDARIALIHHEGKVYTLRATRQGKLLLTK